MTFMQIFVTFDNINVLPRTSQFSKPLWNNKIVNLQGNMLAMQAITVYTQITHYLWFKWLSDVSIMFLMHTASTSPCIMSPKIYISLWGEAGIVVYSENNCGKYEMKLHAILLKEMSVILCFKCAFMVLIAWWMDKNQRQFAY